MTLRFSTALQVDNMPDEALENQFEVVMPIFDLVDATQNLPNSKAPGLFSVNTLTSYSPIVEEITFGVRDFKSTTRRIRTGWVNVPEDLENYRDVAITMFCSSNMLTQHYLQKWKSLIFDYEGEYYNPMHYYKRNIEVYMYGKTPLVGTVYPVIQLTLTGCYPFRQEAFRLKYSKDPKRLTLTQHFKVDAITSKASTDSNAVYTELLSNPASIIDNALNKYTGGTSSYSVENTYD